MRRKVAQIGVPDARPVGLDPDQLRARDEQASVWESVRRPTESVGAFSDYVTVAVQVNGNDLSGSPVREPQSAVVPPRRLGNGQPVEQYARLNGASSVASWYRCARRRKLAADGTQTRRRGRASIGRRSCGASRLWQGQINTTPRWLPNTAERRAGRRAPRSSMYGLKT
jgi:hypothetical protein